jgi:hypothetical protein
MVAGDRFVVEAYVVPTNANSEEGVMTASPVRVTRNLGMLLLAIWLIISGLIGLLSLSFAGLGMLMAVLALAAGVLILIGR